MNQQRQRQANTGSTGTGTGSSVHTMTEGQAWTATLPRTLRLRGEPQEIDAESSTSQEEQATSSRRVRWDENVVNNEGIGKKSSKG